MTWHSGLSWPLPSSSIKNSLFILEQLLSSFVKLLASFHWHSLQWFFLKVSPHPVPLGTSLELLHTAWQCSLLRASSSLGLHTFRTSLSFQRPMLMDSDPHILAAWFGVDRVCWVFDPKSVGLLTGFTSNCLFFMSGPP